MSGAPEHGPRTGLEETKKQFSFYCTMTCSVRRLLRNLVPTRPRTLGSLAASLLASARIMNEARRSIVATFDHRNILLITIY